MDSLEALVRLREVAAPSECGLLEWLRSEVTVAMLEEIAANDRGENVNENLRAVISQLHAGEADRPVSVDPKLGVPPWHPREVLELESHREPEHRYVDAPPSGRRGHVKRLLACTVVLRNVGYVRVGPHEWEDDLFFVEASENSLIQLVRSAIAIGGGVPLLALRFCLWVHVAQPHPKFRPFAAFAVLLLSVHVGSERLKGVNLGYLCRWVWDEEGDCREMLGGRETSSERWLIGLNIHADRRKDKEDKWGDSAKSILGRSNDDSIRVTLGCFD